MPRIMVTIVVLAVAGIVLTVAWRAVSRVPEPLPPPPETPAPVQPIAPPPITDPFTIQVAAYMTADDAQRFVDQLKQAQLDAFWTQAASANRTWYQVKISHFPTKAQAREYGETLKSKGLIDDFYVANYSQ